MEQMQSAFFLTPWMKDFALQEELTNIQSKQKKFLSFWRTFVRLRRANSAEILESLIKKDTKHSEALHDYNLFLQELVHNTPHEPLFLPPYLKVQIKDVFKRIPLEHRHKKLWPQLMHKLQTAA